jgi:hypothetical protein
MKYGRRVAIDPRDDLHPIRARIGQAVERRNITWALGHALTMDQGNTGTCVGHGLKALLMASPVKRGTPTAHPTPYEIYRRAILLDEWSDNDAEEHAPDSALQAGTSVRAGAKALQDLGLVSSYDWAHDVNPMIDFLCGHGPVVIGVNWYDTMEEPDAHGLIKIGPSASVVGGHCVCIVGWSQTHGRFQGVNSWGRSWGVDGRFSISAEDMERLIHEDGEICAPVERR